MKTTDEDSLLKSESKMVAGVESKPYKTSRPWTPLELENPQYEEHIKKREEEVKKKNFLAENVVCISKNSVDLITCRSFAFG